VGGEGGGLARAGFSDYGTSGFLVIDCGEAEELGADRAAAAF